MSAWGASGAWASQAEEEDTKTSFAAERAFPGLGEPLKKKDGDELFPSLGAAAKAPKKKGKPVKMSLSDFAAEPVGSSGSSGAYRAPGRGGGGGRWGDDVVLPTGPSARPDDEDDAQRPGGMKYGDEKLGGAFKDYGGDRGGGRDRYDDRRDDRRGGFGDRDRSRSPPRRGGYGDRDRDFDPRDDRDRSPPRSRADEDDNWGRGKATRSPPPRDRGGYDDRRGGGYGYDDRRGRVSRSRSRGRRDSRSRSPRGGSPSPERDWGALRNRTGPPPRSRSRSPEPERDWGALRNRTGPPPRSRSRSPEPERDWGALRNRTGPPPRSRSRSPKKERDWGALRNRAGPPPRDERDERAARGPRPGQRADEAGDRWGKKEARDLSPRGDRDGDRGDRGRPRLNLQKRSERREDGTAVDAISGGGSSSLFGGARPRELALKEAGRDYRKEDAALSRGGVRRRESNEERALKADVAALAERLRANPDDDELKKEISDKEDALAKLAFELDDKVRFAQREEKAREEREGKERRERREPRGDADRAGNWGEGKTDRQRNGGGRGGKAPGEGGAKKEERKPREPRVMKVAEETGVKIASSSFAALALEEE